MARPLDYLFRVERKIRLTERFQLLDLLPLFTPQAASLPSSLAVASFDAESHFIFCSRPRQPPGTLRCLLSRRDFSYSFLHTRHVTAAALPVPAAAPLLVVCHSPMYSALATHLVASRVAAAAAAAAGHEYTNPADANAVEKTGVVMLGSAPVEAHFASELAELPLAVLDTPLRKPPPSPTPAIPSPPPPPPEVNAEEAPSEDPDVVALRAADAGEAAGAEPAAEVERVQHGGGRRSLTDERVLVAMSSALSAVASAAGCPVGAVNVCFLIPARVRSLSIQAALEVGVGVKRMFVPRPDGALPEEQDWQVERARSDD